MPWFLPKWLALFIKDIATPQENTLSHTLKVIIAHIFFVGSIPIMFLQVAQASYNNNEKPDQSAVLG